VTPEPADRPGLRRFLPFAWLALSATWAAVILVTDQLAWPLALWIATTVGPLTVLDRRRRGTALEQNPICTAVGSRATSARVNRRTRLYRAGR
jgi:hypothetical protein